MRIENDFDYNYVSAKIFFHISALFYFQFQMDFKAYVWQLESNLFNIL